MAASVAHVSADQTNDALKALAFVDAIRRGADVRGMLMRHAHLGDYARTKRETLADFSEYFRQCQLYRVTTVPQFRNAQRLPVSIEWSCPYPDMNRTAGIWFERTEISRVAWGKLPPPLNAPHYGH